MKSRIFDVKTRYASLLALILGVAVAGPALAQCEVTLSTILPNNQAVLKADCGIANMGQITWTRDVGTANAKIFGPYNISPPTRADISFATLLISGTHTYTAAGFDSTPIAVPAGKAAVVSLSQPILTVAVSPGGSVTGVPLSTTLPIGISNCTNTSGVCAAGFETGDTVVLTPTATGANSFAGWGGDCSGNGNCTVSMTTLRTVTANFSSVPTYLFTVTSPAGGTITGSAGGQTINCPGTCTANLPSGAAVSLTANPILPNTLFTWSGNCNGSAGCSFNMPAQTTTVGAAFSQVPTYSLNVTASGGTVSGNGINCTSGGGTCSVSLASGTAVNLTASPTGSNVFNGWSGSCSGSANTCSFNIAGTSNVTANFGAAATYSLTVNAPTGGTISGSAGGQAISCPGTCTANNLANGALVSLNAAPASSGYTFGGWSVSGGSCSGTGACSFSIASASATVTGSFSATGGGTSCPSTNAEIRSWDPFTTTWLYPIPGATFSGDLGLATRIRANGTLYPKGITITIIDQSPIAVSKELVISSCPHDYTVSGYNRRAGNSGMIFYVYFYNAALGRTTPGPYDVVVQDGQDFYINTRALATPRTSAVTVQFSAGIHY